MKKKKEIFFNLIEKCLLGSSDTLKSNFDSLREQT